MWSRVSGPLSGLALAVVAAMGFAWIQAAGWSPSRLASASEASGSGMQDPGVERPIVPTPEFVAFWSARPRGTPSPPPDDSRVTVVIFSDYQCSICARVHVPYQQVLARLERQHPRAIRIIRKDFPLERECNPGLARDLHYAACEAAVAVRLAPSERKARLADWLYANHDILTPGAVRQAARDIGGVTDFDARYAGALAGVKRDVDDGASLGLRGTPTILINGVRVDEALAPEYFEMALAYELSRPPAATPATAPVKK